ncbi:MAG: bifunctional DNA primase/polymerase [Pseudomonadota bacterium]
MGANFAEISSKLHGLGLSFFPCGRDDGKKPLLKRWRQYKEHAPDLQTVQEWQEQYFNANAGIVTGQINNLTVLDCDDSSITIAELQKNFGETPLIVKTRRGHHLYYSYSDIPTQADSGTNIDIRSEGGYVISLGSTNPISGCHYEIIKGELGDVRKLPALNDVHGALKKVRQGQRNNALFHAVKLKAETVNTEEGLIEYASNYNRNRMQIPLPVEEVIATAKKCWDYKIKGRLLNSGQSAYFISEKNFNDLSDSSDAAILFMLVHVKNYGVRKVFIINHEKVAELLNWKDRRKVAKAIQILIDKRKIKRVHYNRGQNGGHKYMFV